MSRIWKIKNSASGAEVERGSGGWKECKATYPVGQLVLVIKDAIFDAVYAVMFENWLKPGQMDAPPGHCTNVNGVAGSGGKIHEHKFMKIKLCVCVQRNRLCACVCHEELNRHR